MPPFQPFDEPSQFSPSFYISHLGVSRLVVSEHPPSFPLHFPDHLTKSPISNAIPSDVASSKSVESTPIFTTTIFDLLGLWREITLYYNCESIFPLEEPFWKHFNNCNTFLSEAKVLTLVQLICRAFFFNRSFFGNFLCSPPPQDFRPPHTRRTLKVLPHKKHPFFP